jgi:hypothetical protein
MTSVTGWRIDSFGFWFELVLPCLRNTLQQSHNPYFWTDPWSILSIFESALHIHPKLLYPELLQFLPILHSVCIIDIYFLRGKYGLFYCIKRFSHSAWRKSAIPVSMLHCSWTLSDSQLILHVVTQLVRKVINWKLFLFCQKTMIKWTSVVRLFSMLHCWAKSPQFESSEWSIFRILIWK